MSAVRRNVLLAVVAVAALIAFLPLRLVAGWVLDGSGITARSANGLLWAGHLDSARAGAFDLRTLNVGLRPLPLLIGRAQLWFERPDAAQPGVEALTGAIETGWNRRALRSVTGVVRGGAIAGLPIERANFDAANVLFRDGQCREASGRITLIPAVRIAGLELRNGLSGDLRCEGRDLAVTLAGQSGMERIALTIDHSGAYSARMTVQTGDPVLGNALTAAGFTPTAGGYEQRSRGTF